MKNKNPNKYDIVIIGGGPAGIAAALYASRTNLDVALIERSKIGGQICQTFEVDNYPGFDKISGKELARLMESQLKKSNTTLIFDEVQDTDLLQETKEIKGHKSVYFAYAVIIASGTSAKALTLKEQSNYIGRGISYSAYNDSDKYKGKVVAVLGGGNSSLEDALLLSKKAKKVYIIHRRDKYRAEPAIVAKVDKKTTIEHIRAYNITGLIGKDKLEGIVIENLSDKTTKELKVDGLFVAIGRGASTEYIDEEIKKTQDGFIISNSKMETSIDGVFAAGDIRNTVLRQIVSATSDGAVAATTAYNFLMKKRGKSYD